MNAIAPCVAECFYLLRLASDVIDVAVLHIAARRGPLKIGVELDAIGRIDVDALHLAPQSLALRQRRHHLQAVAEDHPIGPMRIVLVELGLGGFAWQAR